MKLIRKFINSIFVNDNHKIFNDIIDNKLSNVIEKLSKKGSLRIKDYWSGNSPLMVACDIGHIEIVRFILNNEYCYHNIINKQNRYGYTPLLLACKYGTMEYMHNRRTKRFKDEIKEQNRKLVVNALIRSGECDLDIKNKKGYTAFMLACQNGFYSIVKILIENGCNMYKYIKEWNVDRWETVRYTGMELAYMNNRIKIVELLIEKGFKLGYEGTYIMKWAIKKRHINIINLLVKNGVTEARGYKPRKLFLFACKYNIVSLAKKLLNENKYLIKNDVRIGEYSDLQHACIKGNVEVVKLLMDHGAKKHMWKTSDITSITHDAMKRGKHRVIESLIITRYYLCWQGSLAQWVFKHKHFPVIKSAIYNHSLNIKMSYFKELCNKYLDVENKRVVQKWIFNKGLVGACIMFIKANIKNSLFSCYVMTNYLPYDIKKYFVYEIKKYFVHEILEKWERHKRYVRQENLLISKGLIEIME